VPQRRPFPRPLLVTGLAVAGLVALVGGLALRGPGLVAVGVAGALAACLGWGTAREATGPSSRSNTEAAVLAAAWTVGVLLVLTGTSVLVGGVAAALLAGAGAVTALVVWVVRTPADEVAGAPSTARRGAAVPRPQPAVPARDLPPVGALSTEELGHEWLESSSALTGRLDPAARAALVLRRQQTLDELERRDPGGFLRWLSTGSADDRDPSDFVRGRTAGESAAGTDAA
jgi:hypothetical protein